MLKSVRVKNFLSLRDLEIELDPFTIFIGEMGSGKSNILSAIECASRLDIASMSVSDQNSAWKTVIWNGDESLDVSIKRTGESEKGFLIDPSSIMGNELELADKLARDLMADRDRFEEIENLFKRLVPKISRIAMYIDDDRRNRLAFVTDGNEYRIPFARMSPREMVMLSVAATIKGSDRPDVLILGYLYGVSIELLNLFNELQAATVADKPMQVIMESDTSWVAILHAKAGFKKTSVGIRRVSMNISGETQVDVQ